MRRPIEQIAIGILAVATLVACGGPNVEATQTRATEVAQLATVIASTATPIPTQPTPTTTAAPTQTPAPVPATAITPDYAVGHAQYFAQVSRVVVREPLLLDVTGDRVPEYLYESYGQGCGSCRLSWVTIFSGAAVIFEHDNYLEPKFEVSSVGVGFTLTEKKLLPGESFGNPSDRVV